MVAYLDRVYPFKVYDRFLDREQVRLMTGADFARLCFIDPEYMAKRSGVKPDVLRFRLGAPVPPYGRAEWAGKK